MKILFYSTASDRKKINKVLGNEIGSSEAVLIKDNTSVFSPVLELKKPTVGDWSRVNYAYIPEFGRYYFVSPPELRNDGIVLVSLSIDVLKTYASDLMTTQFMIARSESLWSRYYIDSEYPLMNRRVVKLVPIGGIPQDLTGKKYTITVSGGF